MSEIENHILDVLDANPQGLDHEKLARQVKAVANVQASTISIAISSLERARRIRKQANSRYVISRENGLAPTEAPALTREGQILAAFEATPLLTIDDIADALTVDRSTAQASLKRLVTKGIVVNSGHRRETDGAGRSAVLYQLASATQAPVLQDAAEDVPRSPGSEGEVRGAREPAAAIAETPEPEPVTSPAVAVDLTPTGLDDIPTFGVVVLTDTLALTALETDIVHSVHSEPVPAYTFTTTPHVLAATKEGIALAAGEARSARRPQVYCEEVRGYRVVVDGCDLGLFQLSDSWGPFRRLAGAHDETILICLEPMLALRDAPQLGGHFEGARVVDISEKIIRATAPKSEAVPA